MIDGRWRDWWVDRLIHKNEKEIWVEKSRGSWGH